LLYKSLILFLFFTSCSPLPIKKRVEKKDQANKLIKKIVPKKEIRPSVLSKPIDYSVSTEIADSRPVQLINGLWWGVNKSKVTQSSKKLFTMTIPKMNPPYNIVLLEKNLDRNNWTQGISINASRPADILIDSKGYIHIIAFEPFASDEYSGKYVHYKMKNKNTIVGEYSKTDAGKFAPYNSKTSSELNYGTIYGSAAIDASDNIYIVYNSTTSLFNNPRSCASGSVDATSPHSLTLRKFDGKSWKTEVVSNTLPVRLGYPKIVITNNYIHIASVEDEFRSDLNSDATPNASSRTPYCKFPFIFGKIFHFSRPLLKTAWKQTEILNIHPGKSVQEISDENMRLQDIVVSNNRVYILYKKSDPELARIIGYPYIINFFYKSSKEGSGIWTKESRLSSKVKAPYGYIVSYAKLFVNSSGAPYVFFSGIDVDSRLSSGKNETYHVVKNLSSGALRRQPYVVGSILEAFSYAIFTPNNQTDGSYVGRSIQHLMLYPTNGQALKQSPQLIKLNYSEF